MIGRREFLVGGVSASLMPLVGCEGWREGELRLSFFNTGRGETMFFVFPDGRSMLLDCGDERTLEAIEAMNPKGRDIDIVELSHYHSDHADGLAAAFGRFTFHRAIDRGDERSGLPISQQFVYDAAVPLFRQVGRETAEPGAVEELGAVKMETIAVNGVLKLPDGTKCDTFSPEKHRCDSVPENLMSIVHVFRYGEFSFFTGGDWCDIFREPGAYVCHDDMLAAAVDHAEVAKVNHHGCDSMSAKLVAALSPRLWTACTWHQSHMSVPTMKLLGDRSLYPAERVIATESYGTPHCLTVVVQPDGSWTVRVPGTRIDT